MKVLSAVSFLRTQVKKEGFQMKKLVCLFLVLVMCFSLTITASASCDDSAFKPSNPCQGTFEYTYKTGALAGFTCTVHTYPAGTVFNYDGNTYTLQGDNIICQLLTWDPETFIPTGLFICSATCAAEVVEPQASTPTPEPEEPEPQPEPEVPADPEPQPEPEEPEIPVEPEKPEEAIPSITALLNATQEPTGFYRTTINGEEVIVETFPMATKFSVDTDVTIMFQVFEKAEDFKGMYYSTSGSYPLPSDNTVYMFSIQQADGEYVRYYVSCSPEYKPYGVEGGYSLTIFNKAYPEAARSVTCTENATNTLIPLNVLFSSTISFGGWSGYNAPIPFYKATYDAKAGTISNLKGIYLEYKTDSYGDTMDITVEALYKAAASVEGNVIVISGYPGNDPVNTGISSAMFMLTPPDTFSDVKETDWSYSYINSATQVGLIQGTNTETGSFSPKTELSWAQAVTFAVRLAQYNAGERIYGPEDQGSVWYQVYVDYAMAHGIISKVPSNPNAKVNRGDAFIIFAEVLGDATQINNIAEDYFTDLTPDHPAYEAAYKLANAGISNGMGNNKFGADTYLTREQVATLVARMAGLVNPVIIP